MTCEDGERLVMNSIVNALLQKYKYSTAFFCESPARFVGINLKTSYL